MSNKAKPFTSLRGYYARLNLRKHIVKEWNHHADLGHTRPSGEPFRRINSPEGLPRKQQVDSPDPKVPRIPPGPVCIIGAGVAGLYLGYLIKVHNLSHPDEMIDFEILEASDRTGGRCYTIEFPEADNTPHNYFDAGAMRIPQLESMQFVLDFMRGLGLDVQPYGYSAPGAPELYFNQFDYNVDDITERFDAVMIPFVNEINKALEAGDTWDEAIQQLFAATEPWSTRSYLAQDQGWTQSDINMAELVNTSTGNFDQSLTETVIDYYDFNNASTIPWFRVNGGMSRFTDAMAVHVDMNIKLNTQVTDISYDADAEENACMRVTTFSGDTKLYGAVFCTTSLPCLQQINPYGPIDNPSLGIGLSEDQQTAIRSLHYDLSVKVAIKFSEPWWITKCQIGTLPPYGGSGSTDLPIRTVVYPSWYDKDAAATVLIASYTWSQDATRMGALSEKPNALRRQILADLARLHNPINNEITYEYLDGMVVGDLITWDWNQDPHTGGAFALFGPSQFQTLYPALAVPAAAGKFHICGEHASAHHAWIAGSMTSVLQALGVYANAHGLNKVVQWLDTYEVTEQEKKVRLLNMVDEVELGPDGTSHLLAELGQVGYAYKKKEKPQKPKHRGKHLPIKY